MRSPEEIQSMCHKATADFFPWRLNVLLPYLSFEMAKPFLKDTATAESWGEIVPSDRSSIIVEMSDYAGFAWEKAIGHRGLSAGRSIDKMKAWLWMLEDEELLDFIEVEINYKNYGAPILKAICEKYGFPVPDHQWAKNMSLGKPCRPGCDDGCAL